MPTDTFISLQKRAILKIVEMNNIDLRAFTKSKLTSYIDLQKEAILKIYEMDSNKLEILLHGEISPIE